MGSNDHYPEEAPAHVVTVPGFWIDTVPVTNLDFERFVRDTGYTTLAKRAPELRDYPDALPEMLVAGSLVFRQPEYSVDLRAPTWWEYRAGASWRHPEGPASSIAGREMHPVVHVAYEDAEAFARWAGKALPNEPEWELAARGGLDEKIFSWGDAPAPDGKPMANVWRGVFPVENLKPDAPGTEPVASYPANGYGLYDMTGNVWEWTRDWYRGEEATPARKSCCAQSRVGGTASQEHSERVPAYSRRKVLKGGSFLCAENYCFRFRPAARQAQSTDSSACHIGFRCVIRDAGAGRSQGAKEITR